MKEIRIKVYDDAYKVESNIWCQNAYIISVNGKDIDEWSDLGVDFDLPVKLYYQQIVDMASDAWSGDFADVCDWEHPDGIAIDNDEYVFDDFKCKFVGNMEAIVLVINEEEV